MSSLLKRVTKRNSRPRRDSSQPPRNKALIIGIQYAGTKSKGIVGLETCHRDAREFRLHLIRMWGYLKEDITVMLDKKGQPLGSELYPSRANILAQIDKLVREAQPGGQILFYFAGHGYQVVSHDLKNEPDGYDEAILTADNNGEPSDDRGRPLDPLNISDADRLKLDGLIIDNELHKRLVDALHPDAFLVSIFDCCHSGTMLDLPYHWINRVKRALSFPLLRKSTSQQAYPQSLNKRTTTRSSSGLSTLNRYPPSRDSTHMTQASTDLESAWLADNLCMSPKQDAFMILHEDGDLDRAGVNSETDIPKWSLRREDRRNERSFRSASLVLVPSSPLDCPSDEGSSHSSHPHVLCIAPAEDHEVTQESLNADNRSFTASFIVVMENSPRRLTLKEFMERVRFYMFLGVTKWATGMCKNGSCKSEDFRKLRRAAVKKFIASPQLGSTQPLDLNATFELSRTRTPGNGPELLRTRSLSLPTGNTL